MYSRLSKHVLVFPFSHSPLFFTHTGKLYILLNLSKYHFPITVLADPSSVLVFFRNAYEVWVTGECGWLQIFRLFLMGIN